MKTVYIVFGFVFFIIGAIGVVIPVLPTTPFLVVASFCFAKGSDKFHRWFKSTGLYKKHLEEFEKSKSMTKETKIKVLAFATAMLLLAFWRVNFIHARIAIVCVIVAKYYYILFRVKTIQG